MQLLLLFTTLCIGHVLEKKEVVWFGEAATALIMGMVVGVIVRFSYTDESYDEVMSFQASASTPDGYKCASSPR
jgi:hypothetical protein